MMNKAYNAEIQKRLEEYCGSSGAGSQAKAASAIGLSTSVISQYINNKYPGDINEVENKLREHFIILDEQSQQPSNISPYRIGRDYVPTSISEEIYKRIRYCQLEKGITMIYGDAGIGKTKAAAKFVKDNPSTAIYVSLTPTTGTIVRFTKQLARVFRVSEAQDRMDIIAEIKGKLLGSSKVLVIDEAQHLNFFSREEIRDWTTPDPITEELGVGIVLCGNPILHTKMIGKQEEQHAQQFSRVRPYYFSATQIKRSDVELIFPALEKRNLEKEIDFLLGVCQSRWSLRSAVTIWNDAVNSEDISYKNLKAIAQDKGIGII